MSSSPVVSELLIQNGTGKTQVIIVHHHNEVKVRERKKVMSRNQKININRKERVVAASRTNCSATLEVTTHPSGAGISQALDVTSERVAATE